MLRFYLIQVNATFQPASLHRYKNLACSIIAVQRGTRSPFFKQIQPHLINIPNPTNYSMSYNIVLVCPEIPQNTGNIGRLCVSTGSALHLIKPLGFSLDEKHLRRAGMDYWQHLDLHIYENWEEFIEKRTESANLFFLTTKTKRSFWDCSFKKGDYLVFGNEGSGLPKDFYQSYEKQLFTIPMTGEHCRSLNLANSVSIVLYEGLRQNLHA